MNHLEHLIYVNHVYALLGKDSKRSLEKYLEERKENEKMEGFIESNQTLKSMMEIMRTNIYLPI